MRKLLKKLFVILVISAILILALYGMLSIISEPPIDEMANAQTDLSLARKNEADIYSTKLYYEAKAYYDSAMVTWQKENKKIIFLRNYDKVTFLAGLSVKKALQASENSKARTTDLEIILDKKIKNLNDITEEINKVFTSYPLEPEVRNRISRGKFLLKESEIAYNKGLFFQADRKITEAESLLKSSYENAYAELEFYFKLYPEWKKWIEKTINESKEKRDYAVIVDKYSRKVLVYLNGMKKYEYSAELGKNWVGFKRVSGDRATPEGMYKIIRKFEKSKTIYYKALLLDYPNNEDSARFNADVASGSLPKEAKIGDMIEIHGTGGRGVDWTEGCIALTDKEMDILFRITKIGTPVTIVGSVHDLQYILNR
jgi:hypothetical protein